MDGIQQVMPCDVRCSDPQLRVIVRVTPTYTQGQTEEEKGTKLVRKALQKATFRVVLQTPAGSNKKKSYIICLQISFC